jgi:hypothetical protein
VVGPLNTLCMAIIILSPLSRSWIVSAVTRSILLVRLSAVELRSTVSVRKEDKYELAVSSFCLCRAWCATNLLSSVVCSVETIPSSALNRIVGVIDNSVDTDLGFSSWRPLLTQFKPRGESMTHIGSPVRLTARDGGLLAIRGCPSL